MRCLEVPIDSGILDKKHVTLMFTTGPLATSRLSGYGCVCFVEAMGEATIAHHADYFGSWTGMDIAS